MVVIVIVNKCKSEFLKQEVLQPLAVQSMKSGVWKVKPEEWLNSANFSKPNEVFFWFFTIVIESEKNFNA